MTTIISASKLDILLDGVCGREHFRPQISVLECDTSLLRVVVCDMRDWVLSATEAVTQKAATAGPRSWALTLC